jgi:phenylacetate-CoA ligase
MSSKPTHSAINQRWTWLLRNVVLPLGDMWFGQRLMQRLKFLEEAQWWDATRLHAERDARLARVIRIAAQEVPFYHEVMQRAGVRWQDVQSPADLQKLPIVTKQALRSRYPHGTTRNTGHQTYETSSSGSTGANFTVREDFETAGWYRASFLLALEWAGWQIGEPHIQTGITPRSCRDRRLKDAILNCHYVPAFDLTDQTLDRTLQVLERESICHLWGYPSALYYLSLRARKKGWNLPLKSIVTWGDNLYSHYRSNIERAFGTRVFDTYGCGEGIQIAAQCGYSTSYHVHTLDAIVEYLDDNGDPVRPGRTGNVVVTRLHPGPMPLIRYRLGDLAVPSANVSCPCGRGYDLMQSIEGRDVDIVITPSGNRLVVHFFTGVFEHFRQIACFQVVQRERESLMVQIVPVAGRVDLRKLACEIVSALHEKGAADLRIDVEFVAQIPATPSGKRRFVVSELPKTESQPSEQVQTEN